jgi:hypothetical protein
MKMEDLVPGELYYITETLDLGISVNGRKLYTRNRRVKYLKSWAMNLDGEVRWVADCLLDRGVVGDVEKMVQIPVEVLGKEIIDNLGGKVSVFSPSLSTYFAAPYSTGGCENIDQNFYLTRVAVEDLLASGHMIFSPVIHNHFLVRPDSPLAGRYTALDWVEYNKKFLQRCEQLLIFTIPNWQESLGVQAEIAHFLRLGRHNHIYLLSPEFTITKYGDN